MVRSQLLFSTEIEHIAILVLAPIVISAIYLLSEIALYSLSLATSLTATKGKKAFKSKHSRYTIGIIRSLFLIINTMTFALIEYTYRDGQLRWLPLIINSAIFVMVSHLLITHIRDKLARIIVRFFSYLLAPIIAIIKTVYTVFVYMIYKKSKSRTK